MSDAYGNTLDRVSDPARLMFLIAPHDTQKVSPTPKAVRFDAAGQVTLRAVNSEEDVQINVHAGEVLDVRVGFIRAEGTDDIVIHGFG